MKGEHGVVLITGGAGYIGSVLVRQLLAADYRVRVLDSLRVGGESLAEFIPNPNFEFISGDIREVTPDLMSDCTAVAHLAAVVGDPACKAEPEAARSINVDGSKQLFEAACSAGVRRFVFASTCSNYGRSPDPIEFMREDSPLRPISIYAETKVEFERFLLEDNICPECLPVVLRFSTVYGISPRMRFDLTVNEFTREVATGRLLTIYGEQFWRPYCHVVDLARSVSVALEASEEQLSSRVFNVGDTSENYTKQMLVEAIEKEAGEFPIEYVAKDDDPRDYRVDFSRIREELDFEITRTVPDGVREVLKLVRSGLISDPYHRRYRNC